MRDKRKNNQNGDGLLANFRYQKKWKRATSVLSIFVAVGTISALMLPAITMNQTVCGLEEHSHGSECSSVTVQTLLACDGAALGIHSHGDECYDGEGALACPLPDFVVHSHDSSCLDAEGRLVCTLAEVSEHSHEAVCFQTTDTVIDPGHGHGEGCYQWVTSETPTCGAEESEGHRHGEGCYATGQELICQEPETGGHSHSEECWGEDGALICGQEEAPGHSHEGGCFLEAGALVCTTAESDGHHHGEECFGLVPGELICTEEEREPIVEPGEPVLICELPQVILHSHGDGCYLEEKLICQEPELLAHQHTDACFAQQEVTTLVCTILEHSHTEECYPDEPSQEPALLLDNITPNSEIPSGDAFIQELIVKSIQDGTAPFDTDDSRGNDSSSENLLVRSFDSVAYDFDMAIGTHSGASYSEARIKLECVLPLSADKAVFNLEAMAWIDTAEGYEYQITTEDRIIDGNTVTCQVLTCYRHLVPEGDKTVVPGDTKVNIVVKVMGMANDENFKILLTAVMENSTESKTVTTESVRVTAAPRYNILLRAQSQYASAVDFRTGTPDAPNLNVYGHEGSIYGRMTAVGVILQIYNNQPGKGFKGIELPNGDPISFNVNLESIYNKQNVLADYLPLLWSADLSYRNNDRINADGRLVDVDMGVLPNLAPHGSITSEGATVSTSCYNGGIWTAEQDGSTIKVTVSDYEINVNHMPQYNYSIVGEPVYGETLGIGCFSAGELWILQPFNKPSGNLGNLTNYDIVKDYVTTSTFEMKLSISDMSVTSLSGDIVSEQVVAKDDQASAVNMVTTVGTISTRMNYGYVSKPANSTDSTQRSYRDGYDHAVPGAQICLHGGIRFNDKNQIENQFYWGTSLEKFYGSAITLYGEGRLSKIFAGTAGALPPSYWILYATKPDGTDWIDDAELIAADEEDLDFYSSLSEVPSGKKVVALLYCFKGPGPLQTSDSNYNMFHNALVNNDQSLVGKTFMYTGNARYWSKSQVEAAGMTIDDMPDWTDPNTTLNSFPEQHYYDNAASKYRKTVYDPVTGIAQDHNSDWGRYGDTLLVIGYKTGITISIPQTNENGTVKETYDLGAEQRTVDFCLNPRTYYDAVTSVESMGVITTVTIKATLPQELSFVPGSSYLGGQYTQSSIYGGTQGTITDGTPLEPTVTVQDDGTTLLTWIVPDVVIGESMEPIYFSTTIGNRNDPNSDVPTGTHQINTVATISAPGDMRVQSAQNGNVAERQINSLRLSATAFGKYAAKNVVDLDGQIEYTIYFHNNESTSAETAILDSMPFNASAGSGENDHGNDYSGTYTISSIRLDTSRTNLEGSNIKIWYTFDSAYRGKTMSEITREQIEQNFVNATITEDGTIAELTGRTPTAWAITGTVPASSSVYVNLTLQLQPNPGPQQKSSTFVNTLSYNSLTTVSRVSTVYRSLSGLIWEDTNANGKQDISTESLLSGVKITLMKLKAGGDPTKESDYEPYHYLNDSSKPVVTIQSGQMVSVLADNGESAQNYQQGKYRFVDIPSGTFAVRFESGDKNIYYYYATSRNAGGNDTLDSDAIPTYAATGDCGLVSAIIPGIVMPTAQSMQVASYELGYNDLGIRPWGAVLPNTGGAGTLPYTFSGLAMMFSAGALMYNNKRKSRKGAK